MCRYFGFPGVFTCMEQQTKFGLAGFQDLFGLHLNYL